MKKRGLILSTIVMVVVLAVAITTATYAWFSSSAKVTIDSVNINAEAVQGIEIAVRTPVSQSYPSGYTYGDLAYDTINKWSSTGGNDGFGTSINFSGVEIGTIDHAVTRATSTLNTYYILANLSDDEDEDFDNLSGTYYTVDAANAVMKECVAGDIVSASVNYYTLSGTAAAVGDFLIPIAYDSDVEPIAYTKAIENEHYYDIPFTVHTTAVGINGIFCTISITDNGNGGLFAPGMAAAARVQLITSEGEKIWQPYENLYYLQSGMTGTGINVYSFVLAYGDITIEDFTDLTVRIWVEGTDRECNNTTAQYTNFDVNFKFDYCNTTTATVPVDLITNGWLYNTVTYEWITDFSVNY